MTMEIKTSDFPVDILTAHYRVYGELRILGHPTHYLNNETTTSVTVHDATLMPIRMGVRVGAMSVDKLNVPMNEPQLIIIGQLDRTETRPLPKAARMICFTDTYLVRGTFHMAAEARPHDVFYAAKGAFFLATKLDIVTLYQVAVDVRTAAEMAYIRGSAVRAFFEEEDMHTTT